MRTITLRLTNEEYNNLKILSVIKGDEMGEFIISLVKNSKEWKQFELNDIAFTMTGNQ